MPLQAAWDQNQNVLLVPDQGITLFTVLHLVKDRNMTQEEAISAMKTQGLKFTKRMREKVSHKPSFLQSIDSTSFPRAGRSIGAGWEEIRDGCSCLVL